MKTQFLGFVVLLTIFTGCKTTDTTPTAQTYKGVEQTLGNGKVYTSVAFSADGKPTNTFVTFTKGALDNIPHGTSTDIVLALPTEAVGKTPFDHVFLNFSHSGHEPPGIYDVAHFDIHFVIQPLAERSAIPPYSAASAAKFDNLPPDGTIPPPYFRLPAGVPQMGVHWANPTSPELNGGKFTDTFIMGSYDGKLTFYEPMVTLALMSSSPNVSKNIPTPTKFGKAGYYPMKYSIKQVGTDVVVSLDDMMLMQ